MAWGREGRSHPSTTLLISVLISGPVAPVDSVAVESAEGGDEKKELVLED
jgi:hypothetical protein